MNKKTDTGELDIPRDDIDCWERYPKHRWVYDLSRLLDAQQIGWSPYEVPMYPYRGLNMKLESNLNVIWQPGLIYTKTPTGEFHKSEIYIIKGEIRLIRHMDTTTGKEITSSVGEVELRLNAFVTLHFAKFTGVITCDTHGHYIRRIQLRAYSDLSLTTDSEIIKLARRIYKRTEVTLTGPSDQILYETLAS